MTNGTSQGLFIVVAIVIFGIFVLLSQTLFGDQLSNGLSGLFEDSITLVEHDLSTTRATAQEYFDYELDEESRTATITKYHGPETDVVIPSRIVEDGVRYRVTHIGAAAFYGVGGTSATHETMDIELDSVIIPNTVIHIGSHAFARNRLGSVHIPNSVRHIEGYAFATSRLTDVHIGNNVNYIGMLAFRGNNLSSVELPTGVDYNTSESNGSFNVGVNITFR